jgi:predicted AAA+ superfamily ATPase
VDKAHLKELIVEHKDRFLARRDLISRDIQTEITRYLPQREIVILTGVRRCGKSSLMRLICGDLLGKEAVPDFIDPEAVAALRNFFNTTGLYFKE